MRRLRRAHRKRAGQRKRFTRRAVTAGTAAAITLGLGAAANRSLAAGTPDAHQLPVEQDADVDMLAGREEYAIGYRPFRADQNRNGIPDGVELAGRCAEVIAGLPEYPLGGPYDPPDEVYKIGYLMDGLEQCDVCGEWIHMGGWEIVNPKLHLRYPDPNDPLDPMFLPDLAIHYMQHGSFDCLGNLHRGRVDIARLLRVLELRFPCDPNDHQLPLDYTVGPGRQLADDANDLDGDLLADTEELAAGYDLYDADQDDDLTPDGVELAGQCAEVTGSLPEYDPQSGHPEPEQTYRINHLQRGYEYCAVCGGQVNMGYWQVVNPQIGLSMDVFEIALHYMSHGSFSYEGDLHADRIDVPLLVRILDMPQRCGDLGTLYTPGDLDRDCRSDFVDLAGFAHRWLESTDSNQDGGQ